MTKDEEIIKTITANGEKMSKTKVRHIWHQLYPKEPLPKISVLVVSKEVFLNFQNQLKEYHAKIGKPNHFETCVIKEWGTVVEGGACTIKIGEGYNVLIRSDQYSAEDSLKHEFRHIHDGEADNIENIKPYAERR